jgi:hypothetical protein
MDKEHSRYDVYTLLDESSQPVGSVKTIRDLVFQGRLLLRPGPAMQNILERLLRVCRSAGGRLDAHHERVSPEAEQPVDRLEDDVVVHGSCDTRKH